MARLSKKWKTAILLIMSLTNRQQLAARGGTTATEFRLTPPPKLRDLVRGKNILEGFGDFDAAMERWHQENQRLIGEHLAQIQSGISAK